MTSLGNLVVGILSVVLTVIVGFLLIALVVWLLSLVGFAIPGTIVDLLRLLVVLIAIIHAIRLFMGATRPFTFF